MVSGWGSPLYAALYLTTRTSRASRLADSDAESLLRTSSVKKAYRCYAKWNTTYGFRTGDHCVLLVQGPMNRAMGKTSRPARDRRL